MSERNKCQRHCPSSIVYRPESTVWVLVHANRASSRKTMPRELKVVGDLEEEPGPPYFG